ncbi:MAG: prolipoprotein diacylglyceryl transferase [Flammeovirgaceae bacterium]|nr:prolipoprotein diacylglyceryl transferase [Flammeovirgaceae bacterium]
MLSYFIWNGSPEIFSIGSFSLRWYGLLFAGGFLVSQQILIYIFKKEGKPTKDVDTLTVYMVIATVLGARLGHVIFYQPELFLTDPLSIILPFEFSPSFRFTGLTGLASHGGAIGIFIALWLYARKRKPGQNYLQILDRIAIVVAITGCFIRMGNFFNSEIIGVPTNSPFGVVFMNRVEQTLLDKGNGKNPIESLSITKNTDLPNGANGRVPLQIYLFFTTGSDPVSISSYIRTNVKYYLSQLDEFVDEPVSEPARFKLVEESSGTIAARVQTFGIARHPAQLYESISCLFLFLFLFWYWNKYKNDLPPGRLFAYFMIILWSLRFSYEFIKENQVDFEGDMTLNMGQLLSIPLLLAGVILLVWTYRKPKNLTS